MFVIIIIPFSIYILGIIIYFVKKKPKEIDNIPRISGLPLAWAILRKKSQDEIQDIIKQQSNDYDIIHRYLGPISNINLTSPKYVKDFLMASEDVAPKFETSPDSILYKFFGEGLPFSNGDIWRTSRKLANPVFNRALSPEMVGETVMDLFAFMKQNLNRPVDVHDIMQRITAEVLGKLAFGYQFGFLESEVPHLIKVYKYIMTTIENPFRQAFPWINCLPLKSNKTFFDTVDEFDRFIFDLVESKKNIINNNRKNSYDGHVDVLTSMLELSKQEGIHLENKQLRDEMITLFSAGHDTTSMALSTSFYYLAKYPEIQEKARAEVIRILGNEPVIPTSDQLKEMKYIGAIIKESLRIHPPLTASMPRKLAKPTKIGPYIIPENTLCSVNIWQIHHHPKYWENSEQYNPERFLNNEKRHPFSWIPFSSGPRNCIGQNFSLMEQRIILSMTLLKYHWTLPENSINKDKLLIDAQFLLRPVDLKLVYTERN